MLTGQHFIGTWANYAEFIRLEEEAILRLKWIESEKRGEDIGRYHVEWLWYTTERSKWIRGLQASGVLPYIFS